MTTRMTPERRAEIKEINDIVRFPVSYSQVAVELLSELEAVEAERDKLQRHFDSCNSDQLVTLSLEVETWKERAQINGLKGFEFQNERDTLRIEKAKLIDIAKDLIDTMTWIMPKVHQGNHDGELSTCSKATCQAYREALERTQKACEYIQVQL